MSLFQSFDDSLCGIQGRRASLRSALCPWLPSSAPSALCFPLPQEVLTLPGEISEACYLLPIASNILRCPENGIRP